jgi:ATP-binding cassette, subfamily G (WHITE), member 2, PDR
MTTSGGHRGLPSDVAVAEQYLTRTTTNQTSRTLPNVEDDRPIQLTRRDTKLIGETDRVELERIATALTRRATVLSTQGIPNLNALATIDTSDPSLNPQSSDFDLAKWLNSFTRKLEAEGFKPKRTGVLYKQLGVSGSGKAIQVQSTVGDLLAGPLKIGNPLRASSKDVHKRILNRFDGVINSGELLVVLGRPGSGCSTLLKIISGELHGLQVDKDSTISYKGIPQKQMLREFKGEVEYNQEVVTIRITSHLIMDAKLMMYGQVDKHFPHLTVGQTLEFAAAARASSERRKISGLSTNEASRYASEVIMAVCGLSHTRNTKVGNDFIRGVVSSNFQVFSRCLPIIYHGSLNASIVYTRAAMEEAQATNSNSAVRWRTKTC